MAPLPNPTGTAVISSLAAMPRRRRILAFDTFTDRLLFLSEDGTLKRECGSIGSAPGEFYHPLAIAASNRLIAVLDQMNRRIQILSANCHVIREIPLHAADAMTQTVAIGSGGAVLTNTPTAKSPIARLGPDGRPADEFGEGLESAGPTAGRAPAGGPSSATGFLWLAAAAGGNIYAAGLTEPWVAKILPAGRDLFRIWLGNQRSRTVAKPPHPTNPSPSAAVHATLAGSDRVLAVRAIAFDERYRLLVILSGHENLLFVTRAGELLGRAALELSGRPTVGPGPIAAIGDRVFLATAIPPEIYVGRLPRDTLRETRQSKTERR